MSYIELESVGSLVTNEGLVFPQLVNEPPETASEAEEMMGVHIMDCVDEWWENMGCEDAVKLFQHLAEIKELYYSEGYMSWALGRGDLVAEANHFTSLHSASLHEGWNFDEVVGAPSPRGVK